MKYKICVITGTRAEYGLLKSLLRRLKQNTKIELTLIVTGSHLSKLFGNTQKEIKNDGFDDYISVELPMKDDTKTGMSYATGVAICKFSKVLANDKYDLVLVLGDRFEILSAGLAAFMLRIPIAHIAGGDITEGAMDDSIRHCLTKIASIHFPSNKIAEKRIIQLGEDPRRVFNVGEPGVENCLNLSLLSRQELENQINFDIEFNEYALVTFHPVTLEDNNCEKVYSLIDAMNKIHDMKYIITMANADAGGREINEIWNKEIRKHSNWKLFSSLGSYKYLSALKHAKFVIGNSSSGLIEAPALGVPTVNIGNRQKGRLIADSVVSCDYIANNIEEAIKKVISDDFQEYAKNIKCPFGDGSTSKQIEKHIIEFLENGQNKIIKKFYDIEF